MTRLPPLFVLAAVLLCVPDAAVVVAQPVAVNDTAYVNGEELTTIRVLDNDYHQQGKAFSLWRFVGRPTKGTATISGDVVQYRSRPNLYGADSVTYQILSSGQTGSAKIYFYINGKPVARDDDLLLFSHLTAEIPVLDNDADIDSDSLRIEGFVDGPYHGMAEIRNDTKGQWIYYAPASGFLGPDSLRYAVVDGGGARDTAKVTIDVVLNRPPVAKADSAQVLLNQPLEIFVAGNDEDPDADALFAVSIPSLPMHGTVETVGDGSRLRYTPQPGYLGDDEFVYALSDGVVRNGTLIADRAIVHLKVRPLDNRFEAVLSGGSMVPPTQSRATGLVVASLNGNELAIEGTFSLLEATFAEMQGATVAVGLPGQSGDALLPLTVTLTSDQRSGTLVRADNTFVLTPPEMTALFARQFYVVIRTTAFPGGEIRGQLVPTGTTEVYRAALTGRALVPSLATGASGAVQAELYDKILVVSGSFRGLSADAVQGAQAGTALYKGKIGHEGIRLYPLAPMLTSDEKGGTLASISNFVLLAEEEVDLLRDGLLYVAVPTDRQSRGELRGQLLPQNRRVFEVTLSGRHVVPEASTPGSGGIILVVEGTTVSLAGTFSGLSSPVDLSLQNGVHLHEGEPGSNGPLVLDLAPLLASGRQSGTLDGGVNRYTLTPDQLRLLFGGRLYLDVHTEAYPDGALRGQVLPSANVPPRTAAVTVPADGSVVLMTGEPGEALDVDWNPVDDPNGNAVRYRWQASLDLGFDVLLYESALLAEDALTIALEDLDPLLTARGVPADANVSVYHRVVSLDGGLEAFGPASRLQVARGTATGIEGDGDLPERFAVQGNYPNPFNPVTTVQVDLPWPARVRVELYDLLGRRVLVTPVAALNAGARRSVPVDAGRLGSGVYAYRVVAETEAGTHMENGRMTLLK